MKPSFLIGVLAAVVGVGSAVYILTDDGDPSSDDRRDRKSAKGKRASASANAPGEDRSDWDVEDRVAELENEVSLLKRQLRAIQMRGGASGGFGDDDVAALELDDPMVTESLREIVAEEREREQERELERRRERMKERTDELLDELVTKANINPDQREKIGALWTQERDQTFALMTEARTGDRDFREVRDEARQLRRNTDEQVKAVLSDDQFAAYDELRPRGPGGRGGRGGEGRGAGRGANAGQSGDG